MTISIVPRAADLNAAHRLDLTLHGDDDDDEGNDDEGNTTSIILWSLVHVQVCLCGWLR